MTSFFVNFRKNDLKQQKSLVLLYVVRYGEEKSLSGPKWQVFCQFPWKCFKISEKLSITVCGSFWWEKLFLSQMTYFWSISVKILRKSEMLNLMVCVSFWWQKHFYELNDNFFFGNLQLNGAFQVCWSIFVEIDWKLLFWLKWATYRKTELFSCFEAFSQKFTENFSFISNWAKYN